ncbi:MAG: glycoside hydrolase family 3 protein [Alphaproteobacteria bacterium]|nr:glycoside hydrolase family 3 protein [Alphaproteobacteria bacterium]
MISLQQDWPNAKSATKTAAFLTLLAFGVAAGSLTAATDQAQAASKSKRTLSLAQKKRVVLNAPPEVLRMLGGHVMIGYYRGWQLTPLLKRGAIGGVFVTRRNAKRRSRKAIARELQSFRTLAAEGSSRPLLIATDQEGGLVAHMTPPLKRQTSLGDAVKRAKTPQERSEIARQFAIKQAIGLSDLGINLNFSPVVDLKPAKRLRRDRKTHLKRRAISNDPQIVIEAAQTYCNTLAGWRILCTLKHFPGLQGVKADTHISQAELKKTRQELEASDWLPFSKLIDKTPAAMMIGHAKLMAVDKHNPASASKHVIGTLLRGEWNYDGIIVTDDLDMGAITKRPGGIGKAAVDSLTAGTDILLLTHDGDVVFEVLYALLKAHERGLIKPEVLARSRQRLDRFAMRFSPREFAWPQGFPLPTPAPQRAAATTASAN